MGDDTIPNAALKQISASGIVDASAVNWSNVGDDTIPNAALKQISASGIVDASAVNWNNLGTDTVPNAALATITASNAVDASAVNWSNVGDDTIPNAALKQISASGIVDASAVNWNNLGTDTVPNAALATITASDAIDASAINWSNSGSVTVPSSQVEINIAATLGSPAETINLHDFADRTKKDIINLQDSIGTPRPVPVLTSRVSHDTIRENIQTIASSLVGSLSNYDIAVEIAKVLGQENNLDLINVLKIDFDNTGSPVSIMAKLDGIAGIDGPSIALSVYSMLNSASSAKGLTLLTAAINDYSVRNSIDSSVIISNMKAQVQSLTLVTYNDMAKAIAGAIGASDNVQLISNLELVMDSASTGRTLLQRQAAIFNIAGTDGPSIALSIVNSLTLASLNYSEGITLLSQAIASYSINNSISCSAILAKMKTSVAALNGSFTNHDIAVAIATSVGQSNNQDLIASLELDFYRTGTANYIKFVVANTDGTDGPTISYSLYKSLSYISSAEGITSLDTAINNYSKNNNIDYPTIINAIKMAVGALDINTDNYTDMITGYHDIVTAITTVIGANNNQDLINALMIDCRLSGVPSGTLQSSIVSSLGGDNGATIALSLYSYINYTSASNVKASTLLADAMTTYGADISTDYPTIMAKIQAAVGAMTGSFSNNDIANTIATAINKDSDGDLVSYLTDKFTYSSDDAATIQQSIVNFTFSGSDLASIVSQFIASIGETTPDAYYNVGLSASLNIDMKNYHDMYASLQLLKVMQTAVAALTGSFSNDDIAKAIATSIDAGDNQNLITSLAIEFDIFNRYTNTNAVAIQTSIANLGFDNNMADLSLAALGFIGGITYFLGTSADINLITLSAAIDDYHNNYGVSYSDIVTQIQTSVTSLKPFSNNDIVNQVLTVINAANNTDLYNALTIDLDNSGLSSDNQAKFAAIAGNDGASIGLSIYSQLKPASATQGLVALSASMTANNANNSIDYGAMTNSMKIAVAALTGSFTNHDIAVAMATAIGAGNNLSLINALTLDFDHTDSASSIQAKIANIVGGDGPSIALNLYGLLNPVSSVQGLVALNAAIAAYNNNDSVVNTVKTAVAALNGTFTNHDIAVAVATNIGASNNSALINALEIDLDNSGSAAANQARFASITGTDSSSISLSIYSGLNPASSIQGLVELSADISTAQPQDQTIDITYLNKCVLRNTDDYQVMGSVFRSFDPNGEGPTLNSMDNLVSGRADALAQCATWKYFGNLYATTTHPGGTIGSAEDTGCMHVNREMAGILCEMVFDTSIDPVLVGGINVPLNNTVTESV